MRGLNLPPPPPAQNGRPTARLILEAHDNTGRRGRETQNFWDMGDRLTIQVATGLALYRPDEPVDVDIYTNRREANLAAGCSPRWPHRPVAASARARRPRLRRSSLHAGLQGELTLAAYSPLDSENQYNIPIGTRTILYPHDPALKVTAKFDHATYRPGDDAVLDLHVRGASGTPVEAALGGVIFDQAVEERARTDAEFGRGGGYGFYDSFRSYWYAPAELAGLKREDLDHLDVSEPFNEDMQLAAEVLFMNRGGAEPMVFGGAGYPDGIEAAFRKLLDSEVAPVKKALDESYFKGTTLPA